MDNYSPTSCSGAMSRKPTKKQKTKQNEQAILRISVQETRSFVTVCSFVDCNVLLGVQILQMVSVHYQFSVRDWFPFVVHPPTIFQTLRMNENWSLVGIDNRKQQAGLIHKWDWRDGLVFAKQEGTPSIATFAISKRGSISHEFRMRNPFFDCKSLHLRWDVLVDQRQHFSSVFLWTRASAKQNS